MYSFLLEFHSIFRYVVLIFAIVVIYQSLMGITQQKPYTTGNAKSALFFMISWDLMFLVGILLYLVFSPLTAAAMQDFGGAMKDPNLRFFAVEHSLMMLISLVLVHIGKSKIKKANTDYKKHQIGLIFFGLATAISLFAIPWSMRGYWPQ